MKYAQALYCLIFALLFCFTLAYLVTGAIVWDFNPGHWNTIQRLLTIVVGSALMTGLLFYGSRKKSVEEYKAKRDERHG
jgi:hypothetical protein